MICGTGDLAGKGSYVSSALIVRTLMTSTQDIVLYPAKTHAEISSGPEILDSDHHHPSNIDRNNILQ